MKKNARDKKLSEFHETVVKLALFDNIFVKFLPKFKQKWSWQKFCKILSNFYQIFTFAFCCWKTDKFLLKVRKKLQTKKVDQMLSNVCKFCWSWIELCQTIVSVLREATCKMLKNCGQNFVISIVNNYHTQYCRDKHKCNILLKIMWIYMHMTKFVASSTMPLE